MSWSYSGDPSSSPLDEVRATIGDTDSNNPILQNEEINFAITIQTSTRLAAIKCCEFIIAKTSADVDYKLGPETVSGSQRVDHYTRLLNRLQKSQEQNFAMPLADIDDEGIFDVGMFDCKRLF